MQCIDHNYPRGKKVLVGQELGKLEGGTQTMNELVTSMPLTAGLQDTVGGCGVLARLVEKCQAVVAVGGVIMLENMLKQLAGLLLRNTDLLTESQQMLREESESDSSLRAQYGAKWSRAPSDELTGMFTASATKYQDIIKETTQVDRMLKEKFSLHMAGMAALSGGESGLYQTFIEERHREGSSRQEAVKSLEEAYYAFMELKCNLEEGTKFYNDLTQVLVTFRNKVTDFCFARKAEMEASKAQIESKLVDEDMKLSRLLDASPASEPKAGDLRLIVIDGPNVAWARGFPRNLSVKRLVIAYQFFKEKGHKVAIFLPRKMFASAKPEDQGILTILEERDILFFVQDLAYDDLMIIKYADQKKAIVISNDKFREILQAHPEWEDQILNRTLQFTWVTDTFMVASDPFGRRGPSLDQILHH